MSDTTRLGNGNGNGSRDPRIDRGVSWALQTLMGVAIAVGGWWTRETGEKVDALRGQLGALSTEVAVLRDRATDAAAVRAELRALQLEVTELRVLVQQQGRPPR